MTKKIILFISLIMLASCSHVRNTIKPTSSASDDFHGYYKVGNPYEIEGQTYIPREQPDYDEIGISSWYGDKFHGKQTANGDTYDKYALTAAHNTLPLPSMVRVTNLENNKTLILMVNDRGPFAKGRVIDVSERAAEILGYKDKGIARVRVQFLKGHTKRLLSELPIDPKPNEKKFVFFNREAAEDLYEDDLEENGTSPLDLMPGISKEAAMRPLKKIANMVNPPVTAGLPSININTNSASNWQNPDLTNMPKDIESDDSIVAQNSESNEVLSQDETQIDTIEDITPEQSMQEAENQQASVQNTPLEDMQLPSEDEITFIDDAPKQLPSSEDKPEEANNNEMTVEQHFIQAGTFGVKKNADRAEEKLRAFGAVEVSTLNIGGRVLYRVRLGPIFDLNIAKTALKKVIKLGHADAVLVSEGS